MTFGRTSQRLTKPELSRRLVDFVSAQLSRELLFECPSQSQIAKVLGVSQGMINAVMYGRKSFGRKKFAEYASGNGLSEADLLAKLLSAHWEEDGSSSSDDDIFVEDATEKVLLNEFENCAKSIATERRLSYSRDHKAFDAVGAFAETLKFIRTQCNRSRINIEGVAVLAFSNDTGYVVCDSNNDDLCNFAHRVNPGKLPPFLKQIISVTCTETERDHWHTYSTSLVSSLEQQDLKMVLGGDRSEERRSILLRHIYTEDAPVSSSGNNSNPSSWRYLLFGTFGESDKSEEALRLLEHVFWLGSRLGERVALYGVEDRFRCANRVIEGQHLLHGVLCPEWTEEHDMEVAELYASQLLQDVGTLESGNVRTADIWIYRVSNDEFVCPAEGFRFVSEKHADDRVRCPDGDTKSLREAYQLAYEDGHLTPRRFGRSVYMVANNVATIRQHSDRQTETVEWTSAAYLDRGTFIGIPFLFHPAKKPGPRHIAVLYVRFEKDLSLADGKKEIQAVSRIMLKYAGRFKPLFEDSGKLLHEVRTTECLGKWYDVFEGDPDLEPPKRSKERSRRGGTDSRKQGSGKSGSKPDTRSDQKHSLR